jgi:hypothetical protein
MRVAVYFSLKFTLQFMICLRCMRCAFKNTAFLIVCLEVRMNGVQLVVNGYMNILVLSNRTSVECCSTCVMELKTRGLFNCLSCNYMAYYLNHNVKINYTMPSHLSGLPHSSSSRGPPMWMKVLSSLFFVCVN